MLFTLRDEIKNSIYLMLLTTWLLHAHDGDLYIDHALEFFNFNIYSDLSA